MTLTQARRRIAELEAEVARLSKTDHAIAYARAFNDGINDALGDIVKGCDLPKSCESEGQPVVAFIVDHVNEAMIPCATVGEFLDTLGVRGRPRHRSDIEDAIEELRWSREKRAG